MGAGLDRLFWIALRICHYPGKKNGVVEKAVMRAILVAGLLALAAGPAAADDYLEIPCETSKLRIPHLEAIEAAFAAGVKEVCIVKAGAGRASNHTARFVSSTQYGSYVLSDTLNASLSLWTTERSNEGVVHHTIRNIIRTDDWFEGGHLVGEAFTIDNYDAGFAYVPEIDTTCLVAEVGYHPVFGTKNGYRQVRLIRYCVAGKDEFSNAEAITIIHASNEAFERALAE